MTLQQNALGDPSRRRGPQGERDGREPLHGGGHEPEPAREVGMHRHQAQIEPRDLPEEAGPDRDPPQPRPPHDEEERLADQQAPPPRQGKVALATDDRRHPARLVGRILAAGDGERTGVSQQHQDQLGSAMVQQGAGGAQQGLVPRPVGLGYQAGLGEVARDHRQPQQTERLGENEDREGDQVPSVDGGIEQQRFLPPGGPR